MWSEAKKASVMTEQLNPDENSNRVRIESK